MNMSEVYGQASGVDIQEQERLWNERGKGYYGEYLVFSEIFPLCSEKAKILTNIQVPIIDKSTEIDVLLIDTCGIVSFEVKHYKGTIYGNSNDQNWTQYFRTTDNEVFHSPIIQNDYHISALRNWFPNVPIYSVIVFTNPDVNLRITNTRPDVIVANLNSLKKAFQRPEFHAQRLSENDINTIFNTCRPWAPTANNAVTNEGKQIPLSDYIGIVENKIKAEEKKKWAKKVSPLSVVLTIAGIIGIVLGIALVSGGTKQRKDAEKVMMSAEAAVKEMSSEVSEMQDKMNRYFSKASWNNDGNINLKTDFIKVTNVSIEDSPDLDNGILLLFSVKCNGTDFNIHINGGNELVLLLKDGRSVSGKLSDFTMEYIDRTYNGGREYTIPKLLITGVAVDDIQYIKLTGVQITKHPETYLSVVEDYEFTVFETN